MHLPFGRKSERIIGSSAEMSTAKYAWSFLCGKQSEAHIAIETARFLARASAASKTLG